MRFSGGVRIDPRKVLPSRHSIFVRGFSRNIKVDSVREFFAAQCEGKCKVDFFSFSEDRSKLYVAMRFDSHKMAKIMLHKGLLISDLTGKKFLVASSTLHGLKISERQEKKLSKMKGSIQICWLMMTAEDPLDDGMLEGLAEEGLVAIYIKCQEMQFKEDEYPAVIPRLVQALAASITPEVAVNLVHQEMIVPDRGDLILTPQDPLRVLPQILQDPISMAPSK
ncbi:unnamed protein product [Protopolystoma xenopodis]|uniref:RRM domain-containing protein n=1 Tax=Protopolystoma xenopodis TaxID=117903 RepID=A0A448XK12_9PLAT|nr:unnamed protein product [Protopolystoma xenopodis]